MSTDEAVTEDLVETLEDGKEGFAKAAEKLETEGKSDIASTFRRFSGQRGEFSAELRKMAQQYGDKVEAEGTIAAKLHRGWMSLKDALSGSSPEGVLDAAAQGEDHAVSEYEKALQQDVSAELRSVIEAQQAEVKKACDEVKALRDSAGK